MIEGREDSPPKLGGVAAPSRNAAKPPKHGADGVVPQQNPANRSFGTTPPARPFPEFDGLAGTPPNLGGEFQTLNCQFIHTFYERRFFGGHGPPLQWSIFAGAWEGSFNTLFQQFIPC